MHIYRIVSTIEKDFFIPFYIKRYSHANTEYRTHAKQ